MIGYTCDICGRFKEREPCYTIRPREQYELVRAETRQFGHPQFDICYDCWNEKVYPMLRNLGGVG